MHGSTLGLRWLSFEQTQLHNGVLWTLKSFAFTFFWRNSQGHHSAFLPGHSQLQILSRSQVSLQRLLVVTMNWAVIGTRLPPTMGPAGSDSDKTIEPSSALCRDCWWHSAQECIRGAEVTSADFSTHNSDDWKLGEVGRYLQCALKCYSAVRVDGTVSAVIHTAWTLWMSEQVNVWVISANCSTHRCLLLGRWCDICSL